MQQLIPRQAVGANATRRASLKMVVRRLRLVSGLTLLLFAAMHLSNLAFALRSLDALDAARYYLMVPWTTIPGSLLLLAAAIVHGSMGLVSIAQRRSLAISRTDWVQMILGIMTVPLLLNHALLTGILGRIYPQFQLNYSFVLLLYWKFFPVAALQQILLLVILWVHGGIGLYQWLVLKPVWTRIGAAFMPVLFLVPILALLGFVQGGRDALARLDALQSWRDKADSLVEVIETARPQLDGIQAGVLLVYGTLLLAALATMSIRILRHRTSPVTIAFDGGTIVTGRAGLSILDISLLGNVAHAHVCGGRGRCGTCVVSIDAQHANLSPVNDIEAHTLARIGAARHERLACQARLMEGSIHVTRLQPVYVDAEAARHPMRAQDPPAALSEDIP